MKAIYNNINCKIQAKMSKIKEKFKELLILIFSIIYIKFKQIVNFNNTCSKIMLITLKNNTYIKLIPVTQIYVTSIKIALVTQINVTGIKDNTIWRKIAHGCKKIFCRWKEYLYFCRKCN